MICHSLLSEKSCSDACTVSHVSDKLFRNMGSRPTGIFIYMEHLEAIYMHYMYVAQQSAEASSQLKEDGLLLPQQLTWDQHHS